MKNFSKLLSGEGFVVDVTVENYSKLAKLLANLDIECRVQSFEDWMTLAQEVCSTEDRVFYIRKGQLYVGDYNDFDEEYYTPVCLSEIQEEIPARWFI